ncbi:ubiquinone/menaquinone biosynthesis C-methylase UbiE [Paenibacillus castaneae]|uniref:class I SAM-dependent methyltransferase n=1 Tax=Paenibacillus castaneae TaxID=474957 RepID=UPI000C9987C9|nr:methyltransferase domain-containing protein [Paenibacillus castaneae]NIK79985.1 ubiquinone/menaquinone biosynthesis C-methylase UbiE [Paenibacillus castaneae]
MKLSAYDEVCNWEKSEAVYTLQKCGLREGMVAMDLGCGLAHYTIPAALTVGRQGRVIAVDHDKKACKTAYQRIQDAGITNVEMLRANHIELEHIPESSIDFLMIYDMIHGNARIEMYPVVKRLLKKGGILSFLAFDEIRYQKSLDGQLIKSNQGKNMRDTYDIALKKMHDEIISNGFALDSIVENGGVHFDHFHSPYHWKKYGEVRLETLERGNIYNFVKQI